MKESDLLKLQLDQIETDVKVDINEYIQFGKHSDEEFKRYIRKQLDRVKEAERKWERQLVIEYIEENNLPMSYLDQLPKSIGGNKE